MFLENGFLSQKELGKHSIKLKRTLIHWTFLRSFNIWMEMWLSKLEYEMPHIPRLFGQETFFEKHFSFVESMCWIMRFGKYWDSENSIIFVTLSELSLNSSSNILVLTGKLLHIAESISLFMKVGTIISTTKWMSKGLTEIMHRI